MNSAASGFAGSPKMAANEPFGQSWVAAAIAA